MDWLILSEQRNINMKKFALIAITPSSVKKVNNILLYNDVDKMQPFCKTGYNLTTLQHIRHNPCLTIQLPENTK